MTDLALKPAPASGGGVSPILSNANAFLDLLMGSKNSVTSGGSTTTQSGGTTTQQTQLSPDAINNMIRTMFEGTGGLADIALGAHTAGVYGDTSQVSLLQNLITKIAGATAQASAPVVTTTSPRTTTTTPSTTTTATSPKLTGDSLLQSILLAGGTAVGTKLLKKSGLLDALGLGDDDSKGPLSAASNAIQQALGFGGISTPGLTASNLASAASVPAGAVDIAQFAGITAGSELSDSLFLSNSSTLAADTVGATLTAPALTAAETSVVDPITGAVSPTDQIAASAAGDVLGAGLTTGISAGAGALGLGTGDVFADAVASGVASGVPGAVSPGSIFTGETLTSAAGSGGLAFDPGVVDAAGNVFYGQEAVSAGLVGGFGTAEAAGLTGDLLSGFVDFGGEDLVAGALGAGELFAGSAGLDLAAGAALDFGLGDLLVAAAPAASSIVCYELVRTGDMPLKYAKISSDYAVNLPKAVIRGYHYLCPWLLRMMRKYKWAHNILKVCANVRSKELESKHLGGKIVRIAFEPICFLLGHTIARRTGTALDISKMLEV